jgi:hypothetical protein
LATEIGVAAIPFEHAAKRLQGERAKIGRSLAV